ncbi:MAG: GC-type dockerin domain-anchored protein [Phycisphaerales bacterium]
MTRTVLGTLCLAGVAGTCLGVPTPIDLGTAINDLSDLVDGQLLEIDYSGEGTGDIQFGIYELAPDIVVAGLSRASQGLAVSDELSPTFPDINDPTAQPPANVVVSVPAGEGVVSYVDAYEQPGGLSDAFAALYIDFPAYGDPRPLINEGIVLNQAFYVGVKFRESLASGAPVHYGWALVRLDWDGPGGAIMDSWEILAAAYESDPDTDIAAGDSGPCNPADVDGNGTLNLDDVNAFATAFTNGDLVADLDGNGTLNLDDVNLFAASFIARCP